MNLKIILQQLKIIQEGITFRDISPLMADGNAYSYAVLKSFSMLPTRKLI